MTATPDRDAAEVATTGQSLGDRDSSVETDANVDPAQAEWERTTALDEGRTSEEDVAAASSLEAAGDDRDEIPVQDLPDSAAQPETQGVDPEVAELGEEGQGDLAPEDL